MKGQPRTNAFRSPRTRIRFLGKLLQDGVKADSAEFVSAQKLTQKKHKHGGKCPGAFGRIARKANRDLYGVFKYSDEPAA